MVNHLRLVFLQQYKAGKRERLENLGSLSKLFTLRDKSHVNIFFCPLIYNAKSANQVARFTQLL
jgi:hypothetical protein